MRINRCEDITSWQKSKELIIKVYKIFRNNRNYSFKDQIQRCAISIMNNIAEGFERGGNKEFKYFLFTAKGSCGEFRSMTYLAAELEYLSKTEFEELHQLSMEISRLISGLIKTL